MNKEQFLELASELFDQTHSVLNEEKIVLDKNTFDELLDQISSDIKDLGGDIVEEYKLEMYDHEVNLDDVTLNFREIESTVARVLKTYFERK